MVIIPKQYWLGDKCVETRTPWLVPGAINVLDRFLNKSDKVLEFGCGGSTLFFADRCKQVVSFELGREYFEEINRILRRESIKNVRLMRASTFERAVELLEEYKKWQFNVVMPDWNADRDFLRPFLRRILDKRFMLVIDNYNARDVYPESFSGDYFEGVSIKTFAKVYDDGRWYGKGTKVYSSSMIDG